MNGMAGFWGSQPQNSPTPNQFQGMNAMSPQAGMSPSPHNMNPMSPQNMFNQMNPNQGYMQNQSNANNQTRI
jgi:hypothetical protein